MSRELLNVNETSTIKSGDDSTTLILSAHDDNEPRIFKAGDIATIHIDTDDAHVADVPAKLIVGSNNINVNSADLAKLAPGNYQLELWVSQKDGPKTTIYPSDGFLDLTIDRNADNLEGGKITTITLDDFKKQLNDAITEAEKKAVPGKDGKDGSQGPQGEPGPAGKDGQPGKPGKSAYELAVDQGFSGTESQWLESLKKGPAGPQGQPGKDGKNGIDGKDGKSAYELAKEQGFTGTESEWLKSLVGPEGPQGPQGLPGKDGHDGEQGPAGQPGQPGKDGQNGKDGKDGLTPTFKFGPVVTLPTGSEAKADLTKNDDDGSYTINLSIPAGPKGETGGINQVVKPDLAIGTVQTVASDQNASASLTKTGETGYAINLSIPAGPAGKSGVDGKPGKDGSDGKPGADGKSAYELAVAQGFKGDLTSWLESLHGPQGKQGEQGPAGKDGERGADGKQGPAGQPGQPGKDGKDGQSAYQIAVNNGFSGSETDWLASLKGHDGHDGAQGPQGLPGAAGKQGPAGQPGKDGKDGQSAYQIAVTNGFSGSETDWLASLKGHDGHDGAQGPQGLPGADGQPGQPGKDGKNGKRGPVIWQTSQMINTRGGSYSIQISTLTSDVSNVTPAVGDVIIASSDQGSSYALLISSVDSNNVNFTSTIKLSGDNGSNGHSVWAYSGSAGNITTPTSSLLNYDGSREPDYGDLVIGNDGSLAEITSVGSNNQYGTSEMVTTGNTLATIKSQSDNATPTASTFDYKKYPNMPIISQENLGHYLGLDSTKSYTLNVDDNTLNDGTNTTQKALKPGIYLLRDYQGNGYNLTIKSDQNYGLAYGTLVQLIVTPYMIFAVVVGPYQSETLCARMQWDHDFSNYYGVSNKWFIIGQESKATN